MTPEELHAEMAKRMEELGKPSVFRMIITFPITLIVAIMIPLGFLLGAIIAGLMVGMSKFKEFSARMALEGLAMKMRQEMREK